MVIGTVDFLSVDLLRMFNILLAFHGLTMMLILRGWWLQQAEEVRLALLGLPVAWFATLYSTAEALAVNSPPGLRVITVTVALCVFSVGAHRMHKTGKYRPAKMFGLNRSEQ